MPNSQSGSGWKYNRRILHGSRSCCHSRAKSPAAVNGQNSTAVNGNGFTLIAEDSLGIYFCMHTPSGRELGPKVTAIYTIIKCACCISRSFLLEIWASLTNSRTMVLILAGPLVWWKEGPTAEPNTRREVEKHWQSESVWSVRLSLQQIQCG